MRLVILLFMLMFVMPLDAGAATLTVGPTDCSVAAVTAAISAARDGDTVLLTCTGTVTWSSTVNAPDTKGITLAVQGGTTTPKTSASFPFTFSSGADPVLRISCKNNRALNRVTGFKFRNTVASDNGAVFVQGRGTGTGGLGCFRIDNNYFDSVQLPHADLAGTVTVWSLT